MINENQEIKRNELGQTEQEFLAQYDASRYERPSNTVDIVIFTVMNKEEDNYRKLPEKELKVLMIKRKDHPYIGEWALPGGFVNIDKDIDEEAARELREETGVENVYLEQLYTWGDVKRSELEDTPRDPRTRVISNSYMALVDSSNLSVQAGDDAAEAKWFSVSTRLIHESRTETETGYVNEKVIKLELKNGINNLSASIRITETMDGKVYKVKRTLAKRNENGTDIAFDHAKMIQYAVERLRNKIEYSDIAFNLMPDLFTLTELQQVYEVILDKKLYIANFRRQVEKIRKMVIETNEIKKGTGAGHRPSKFYKFNPNWVRDTF